MKPTMELMLSGEEPLVNLLSAWDRDEEFWREMERLSRVRFMEGIVESFKYHRLHKRTQIGEPRP